MSEKTPVNYAPSDRIDEFKELASDFLNEVLGLPWALITDESALSDFSGCGFAMVADADDETRHAMWEQWVVDCVCQRYRIEPFPVSILLVQLFERIDRAAPLQ